MQSSSLLERDLANLLKYGTIVCSVSIGMGVLLDLVSIDVAGIDFVVVGIVGFILLPILRLLTMLKAYWIERDVPMIRVVALVIGLVVIGAIAGLLW